MKYKKIIFSIVITFVAILIGTLKAEAADLELRNLEYKVILNSDGSADVTEVWNIYIEDTNTLFKTFEVDKSKYKEITNVTVTEVTKGKSQQFKKIAKEMYHVPKGYYYGLINKNRKFEIAWGVQVENEIKTYEISYKIIDAVKNYNDCSEFYWQFISTISEIPAKKVYGTIQLPSNVSNLEDFRVWAHGPLNGNITKTSNDTVVFEVEQLNAKTMLEARVITPKEIFLDNENVENIDQLQTILNQEEKWAKEANEKREAIAKRRKMVKTLVLVILVGMNIVGGILAIYLINKIRQYRKILQENPKVEPEQKLKYFRDMPDETATPAQAAFLYYFGTSGGMQIQIPKVVSAIMLDLCLKNYIEFEMIAGKKEQIKIIIKPEQNVESLTEDEKIVYDILTKIPKENHSFTMKEFQKYCNRHNTSINSKFDLIYKKAKEEEQKKENYQEELIKQSNKWTTKGVGFIFLAITSLFVMWLTIIPAIISAVYTLKIGARLNRLTQKGVNEKEQWIGLKQYMEDFSMIQDKTVPELILWEKYLVYATAFGIADKVIKQLKVVYPQISDPNYMNSHGYTYMYLMYSGSFHQSFINTLNHSVTTTYNSMNYSSGTGAGGGFSGGGGFGGGGGRNGRKINGSLGTVLFGPNDPKRDTLKKLKFLIIKINKMNTIST